MTDEQKNAKEEAPAAQVFEPEPEEGEGPANAPVAEGWMRMEHPDSESGPTEVTREAFNEVWKDLGWRDSAKPEANKSASTKAKE
jgi:hypothetical protein